MIEEVAYDPVQVHSPGWQGLARAGATSLREARSVVIRERPGRLMVHCDVTGLAVAQRKACARVITWLQATAAQTCQACGSQGEAVASPDGRSPLRLCRACISRSGQPPVAASLQWSAAETAG
ncbi:hypothetical protein [Aquisalimonas asiatica]|uniref:Uncharacterized protein n=1 Tax=Aquisalimonas asiatica TaxID=406100 RepID=A0A1H8T1F9_9GAMM|nr:hypothetical protein [Aquisalimonas asiatica]SEO84343.1 hypothetical protein SAMN04488052_103323 [Aquisalimonas asiatica]